MGVQEDKLYLKVAEWVSAILAIVGAFLISFGLMYGFLLWLISNTILILWSIKKKAYGIAFMQTFFFITSVIGTYRWIF